MHDRLNKELAGIYDVCQKAMLMASLKAVRVTNICDWSKRHREGIIQNIKASIRTLYLNVL